MLSLSEVNALSPRFRRLAQFWLLGCTRGCHSCHFSHLKPTPCKAMRNGRCVSPRGWLRVFKEIISLGTGLVGRRFLVACGRLHFASHMRPNRSRDLTSLFKPMNSNVPSTIKRVDLVGTDASITMVLGSLQTGLMHKICKLLRSNGDRKNANAAAKAKEMRKLAREKWRKLAGFTDESVAVPAAVQEERHVVVPAKVEAPAPTPEKFKLPYITSEAARACSLLLLQVLQLEELGLSISEVETLTRGSNDEAKMHRGVRRSIALATALARGVVCNEPPSTRPEVLVAAVSRPEAYYSLPRTVIECCLSMKKTNLANSLGQVLICLESHFAPLVDGPENVAKTISFFGRTQEAHTSEAIRTELERVLCVLVLSPLVFALLDRARICFVPSIFRFSLLHFSFISLILHLLGQTLSTLTRESHSRGLPN